MDFPQSVETVEPVFGQIKQGRGFRRLLLRGLEKVNREWLLTCAGHHLLKLFRLGVRLRGKSHSPNRGSSLQPSPPVRRSNSRGGRPRLPRSRLSRSDSPRQIYISCDSSDRQPAILKAGFPGVNHLLKGPRDATLQVVAPEVKFSQTVLGGEEPQLVRNLSGQLVVEEVHLPGIRQGCPVGTVSAR